MLKVHGTSSNNVFTLRYGGEGQGNHTPLPGAELRHRGSAIGFTKWNKEYLYDGGIMMEGKRKTSVYFVRHAQPEHTWEEDRTRPLTQEGLKDSKKVTEVLKNFKVDCYLSSPYKRSFDTICEIAEVHSTNIITDERFRERENGLEGNNFDMFQKRWRDFHFHEEGGESLHMVQQRNIEALMEVLNKHYGKNIVIGTHGTALSTILNYFEPSYCCNDFLRIIDYMPYIIRLDFEGSSCIGKEELLIVEKKFK